MGVDVYLEWEGMTEKDRERQITGFKSKGSVGYLRGAYFGGYAGVLEYLFGWADWSQGRIPFGKRNQKEFEKRLKQLEIVRANRPSVYGSAFADLPFFFEKMGFKNMRFAGGGGLAELTEDELKEYRDFLKLARKLTRQGKKVWIVISY